MGREFEVKYALSAEAYEGVQAQFSPFRTIQMTTAYFDAPDGRLSARRWTLRRRLENGVSVCTLKIPLPGGAKGEWETVCGSVREAVPALIALGAPSELAELTDTALVEICGAMFTRLAADVTYGQSRLELSLDKGFLFKGDKTVPLLELEAEVKEGTDTDAVAFGQVLAALYGLHLEPKSKFKRAREL